MMFFPDAKTILAATLFAASMPAAALEIASTRGEAAWSLAGGARTGLVDGAGREWAAAALSGPDHPAGAFCASLDEGGFRDWRLPDLFDLAEVEAEGRAPVEAGVMIWSAVEYTTAKAQAWSFGSSSPVASMPKTAVLPVICVRDADDDEQKAIPAPCPATGPGEACGDGTVAIVRDVRGRLLQTPGHALPPMTWSAGATDPAAQVFVGGISGDDGAADAARILSTDADLVEPGFQDHPAARSCASLRTGGHADWRLPSIGELRLMRENRASLPFLSGSFWSSTEVSADRAMTLLLGSGRETAAAKTGLHRVQCVRTSAPG
jgi:hypothetical protein